jgi:hypothetical protein
VLARIAVAKAFVQISGGLEIGASGEILIDHGLSSTESPVLDGFDITFVGVYPNNIIFSLLLENKSGANAQTADAQHSHIIFGESHCETTCVTHFRRKRHIKRKDCESKLDIRAAEHNSPGATEHPALLV